MKSLRLTSLLGAAFLSLLLLAGCKEEKNQNQQAQNQSTSTSTSGSSSTSTSSATASGTAETDVVSPDEQIDGAEVSLTKNYYFVLDGSGSMDDCPPTPRHPPVGYKAPHPCIPKIVSAVDAIRTTVAQLTNDSNVGLYVFDKYGDREVISLGLIDRPKFEAALAHVRADNGTPLGAAIAKGVTALDTQRKKQLGFGDYRLMIVTDGEATDDLSVGVNAILKTLTPTYTIGFGIGEDHALRKYSLHYWAADTGDQVKAALTEVVAETNVNDPSHFLKK